MWPSKPQESASSVCLSVFFNDALWKYVVRIGTICFLLPTHSWTPSSASFYYFVRLKGFSLEHCNPRELFSLSSSTLRAGLGSSGFWKRMSVQIGARRRREWTSRTMTSPVCATTEWVGPNSCGVQYVFENVQRPLCHLKNVCDRNIWHDPFVFCFFVT